MVVKQATLAAGLVFFCVVNSAHADVPPPAAKCASEGATCAGSTIGLLGFEYQGTCIQDSEKKYWYCKTGATCYSAKGPGDVPSPGYGERPCYEVIVAVPSAMPTPSVMPKIESKPASSCTISITHRNAESALGWVIIAFMAIARRARRV